MTGKKTKAVSKAAVKKAARLLARAKPAAKAKPATRLKSAAKAKPVAKAKPAARVRSAAARPAAKAKPATRLKPVAKVKAIKVTRRRVAPANPLLAPWTTPFEMPPFDRIRSEHFLPAFEKAFADNIAEIEA